MLVTYQRGVCAKICCHTLLLPNSKVAQTTRWSVTRWMMRIVDGHGEVIEDVQRVGKTRETPAKRDVLCDRQEIVPIHTLVFVYFVICAYATGVDHDTTRLVCLWIEQVVALRTKLQGSLIEVYSQSKWMRANTEGKRSWSVCS